jgi:hypothetical protein
VESVEEYFYSVSLHDVFSKNDGLSFNNGHFEQAEQEDKSIKARLTK